MKIIKDKQITEDNCTHVADNDPLSTGNITVSLARWKKEKSALTHYNGNIGIRLSSSDKIEDIADDLENINLIALEFPVFTDGRGFSQARLLRERYHYEGEIRAIGSYMPDQAFYLYRVGVNAFESETPDQLSLTLSTLKDFTVHYQTSTN
jgi:uncharacterized protein (DUF934 family)